MSAALALLDLQQESPRAWPRSQPPRARPRVVTRADTLLTFLRTRPKSHQRAALLVLEDMVAHSVRIDGPRHNGDRLVERGPAYYRATGQLPDTLAREICSLLVQDLDIPRIRPLDALALGVPLRQLKPGKSRGGLLLLTAYNVRAMRELAQALREDGLTPPPSCKLTPILGAERWSTTIRRGRSTFIRCPTDNHNDEDPSALVNPDGAVYCFGCRRLVAIREREEGDRILVRLIQNWRPGSAPDPSRPGEKILKALDGGRAGEETEPTAPMDWSGSCGYVGPTSDLKLAVTIQPPTLTVRIHPEVTVQVHSPSDPLQGVRAHLQRARQAGSLERIQTSGYERDDGRISPGLKLGFLRGDRSNRGMTRSLSGSLDLLDLLRTADRRDCGPKARARAAELVARTEQQGISPSIPDRYVSLQHHYVTGYRTLPTTRRALPSAFVPAVVRWVGVDLDGFTGAPLDSQTLAQAGERLRTWAERQPELTGRLGVVRTSSRGVQVVLELSEARWSTKGADPMKDGGLARLLDRLDARCLLEVREAGFEGGHADRSARTLGRYFRRPGARWKKGALEFARLVYATQ